MQRTLLKSKIHRATVTDADLAYEGSITLDPVLMEAADLLVNERVEVYNVTNGNRLATYAIPGTPGQGEVILNGAAAHLFSPGDLAIICSYATYDADELAGHQPKLVFVDADNRIARREGPRLATA